MSDFLRGLIYGVAALAAGIVLLFIGLSIASAMMTPQSGHSAVFLPLTSPLGATILALLLLAFVAGFTRGARGSRHAQSH